jgi:hypothetical protein
MSERQCENATRVPVVRSLAATDFARSAKSPLGFVGRANVS